MGLFGSSGVRGVVNVELTPGEILRLAAVATAEWDADRVAIAHDTRIPSEACANAASSGVASAGADVDRIGVIPTPGLQRYLARENIPGLMVTASHNPPRYAGMKLFDATGIELGGERLARIEQAYEAKRSPWAAWDAVGNERQIDTAVDHYLETLHGLLADRDLKSGEGTVAIDPGHGAACRTTGRFFREIGCRVVSVNDTMDGRFPGRQPEPIPAVLDDLAHLTRASDAIMGIAHDGDGDRAVFVDETGTVVSGDSILAILAEELVSPGDVVVSAVNASNRLADAVESNGGELIRTPIGSVNIVEKTASLLDAGETVPVAGEGNGGLFLPMDGLFRDALLVAGMMLSLAHDTPLGERAETYTEYQLVREELPYENTAEKDGVMERIEAAAVDADAIERTDGIRVEYDDGWTLVRPSGTEPVIRFVSEATSERVAIDRLEELLSIARAATES